MTTNQEYHLKCKVKVINQSYVEVSDGRRHETKSVCLIPDLEASETWRFLTAWLPEASVVCLDCRAGDIDFNADKCPYCDSLRIYREHSEAPSFVAYPVNSPCRMAVMRKNKYCAEHHLFVMSSGVEADLRNMDGKTINVVVLPASQDEVCDSAPSVTREAKI